ncbi:MAG: hypothetical protein IPJ61_02025 [Tessaracoccus sp.]|uniref:VOC family protein n=1 Tax=Tessaracoccus sp. TaxID=1971211 RepID=UPI001ECF8EFD|nr:hypothetical protein [Tessaracoccus sp.]MBK7819868.1 hypothetical protein [Tessaracoccus sp.]
MITVQLIYYTSHTRQWRALARALGLTPPFTPGEDWAEFEGGGILAIHYADGGRVGTADLHFLVDDLDATEARLRDAGLTVESTMLNDVGPLLTITAASGATISASAGARVANSGTLAVQPIWFQADLDEPRRILETLGLRARLASDSGGWIEFEADGGGSAALHAGDAPTIGLSLECTGDLDDLARRLTDSGFAATVVDEAYNRTLRVVTPDGDELWINGAMDDLYGYTRLDA